MITINSTGFTDLTDIRFNMPFSREAIEQTRVANDTKITSFMHGRLDLRGKTVLAFKDADGCDCAFSIKRSHDGFELGVHIIDADEFVCSGTPLDDEAAARFTSCEISGIKHAILPEKLLNGVLGFAEGVDRLAVSVIITVDEYGTIKNIDLQKSVIRASVVCDYSEIDAFYKDTDRSELIWIVEKYAAFKNEIEMMYDLGARLHAARRRAGAAEYSEYETVTHRDADGKIDRITRNERESDSNRLITEFLLYAGCMTARLLYSHGAPNIYTRCDAMSAENAEYLAKLSGFDMPKSGFDAETAQRELASHISLHSKQQLLAAEFSAAMPEPYYSDEYGRNCALGITGYMRICHPTCNYPDLIGQRIIKSWIKSGGSTSNIDTNRQKRIIASLLPLFNGKARLISQAKEAALRSDLAELLTHDSVEAFYIGDGNVILQCGARGILQYDTEHVKEPEKLKKLNLKVKDAQKMIFCFT